MAAFMNAVCAYLPTIFVIVYCFVIVTGERKDDFKEELFIKPLQSGHVYFHFQFTTKWDSAIDDPKTFRHYRLFPKPLGDVLATYSVQELHLSQTQGLWRYDKWGYPVRDAPPGTELWVWFQPSVRLTQIDQRWAELVNALSGLFCSSLNFLDTKATVGPRWSFRPEGLVAPGYAHFNRFVRYGALPREVVCTENLTPWKKLLPCDSKAGLASLFQALKLYDADFHSLSTDIRPVCRDEACTESSVELRQSLAVVFDATVLNNGFQDWSLKKMFGHSLSSTCPMASSSHVFVDLSSNLGGEKFALKLTPTRTYNFTVGTDQRLYALYDLGKEMQTGRVLNIAAQYSMPHSFSIVQPPPVYATRFVTGYGLERGGVTCLIHNNLDTNVTVIYMDTIPWFLRVFFKSLSIENEGIAISPYKLHFQPGRDRGQPYHLELVFRLRPRSTTKLSFQFERAFLKWTEYPPDANHGFYANAAVISVVLPDATQYTSPPLSHPHFLSVVEQNSSEGSPHLFVRLRTEVLLVSLPTPDFSMPYNVICLACTVVAIAFGSLHNLFTRRFTIRQPDSKGLLSRTKDRIRGLFSRKKTAEAVKGKEAAEEREGQEGDEKGGSEKEKEGKEEDGQEGDEKGGRDKEEKEGKEEDKETARKRPGKQASKRIGGGDTS